MRSLVGVNLFDNFLLRTQVVKGVFTKGTIGFEGVRLEVDAVETVVLVIEPLPILHLQLSIECCLVAPDALSVLGIICAPQKDG